MVAVVTEEFKKFIVEQVIADVQDSAERYYIGIGRSEDWDSSDTPVVPAQNIREERNARLSLQSIKQAEDVARVVPRNNWSAGTIYSAYNDNQAGYPTNAYYVFTAANACYLCLQQGKNSLGQAVPSTVQPTGAATTPFLTADGYVWKYLFQVTALNASKFLTANYMPVRLVGATDSSSPPLDIDQKGVQDAAIPGQIPGYRITNGGSGYISAPTVTIYGDGDSAQATATISGGAVVKVEPVNESAGLGTGYTYANAVFTGGSPTEAATAIPIIGPSAGFGADPRNDLKATAAMFNTKPAGTENGDFIVGQDFRRILLFKDLKKVSSDSDFTDATGFGLPYLKLSSVSTAFTNDKIIEGQTSGAQAVIDWFNDSSRIYYHQSEATGFLSFQEGETVNETNGAGSGILDSAGFDSDTQAFDSGEFDRFSGRLFYIDNRASVDRSEEQTEDIKVIIQL